MAKFILFLFLLSGCIPGSGSKTKLHRAQQYFVCEDNGGLYVDVFDVTATNLNEVKCNDGLYHTFRNIKLPERLWIK